MGVKRYNVAIFALLAVISTSPATLILPSFTAISREFSLETSSVTLLLSTYLLSSALFSLGSGYISDRFGYNRVISISLIIFIFASIGCGVAQDFSVMLFFRILQAVVSAVFTLIPVAMLEMYGKNDGARAFSFISSIWALTPIISPIIGGVAVSHFGWRSVFFVMVMAALLACCLFHLSLRDTASSGARPKFVKKNYISTQQWLTFSAYTCCLTLTVSVSNVFLVGAPVVASYSLGLNASKQGFLIASIGFGFVIGSMLASAVPRYAASNSFILIGRSFSCCILFSLLATVLLSKFDVYIFFTAAIMIGVANGLTLPGSRLLIADSLGSSRGLASGLSRFIALTFSALVAAGTGYFLELEAKSLTLVLLMLVLSLVSFLAAFAAFRLAHMRFS